MIIHDRFDGRDNPFEGDLTLTLRCLPADARVIRATARVIPIDDAGEGDPFLEKILFDGARGDWGATRSQGASASIEAVEVDFHNRRTLAAVQEVPGDFDGSEELQANLGGAYVKIDKYGAIAASGDDPFELSVLGGIATLPSLTVTRFQLSREKPKTAPALMTVFIRSVPSNVSLSLQGQPPFFVRPGEMARPEDVPDFVEVLGNFLAQAEPQGGFFSIPLVAHSDSIARLEISVEIEFVIERNLLDSQLERVSLTFGASTRPDSQPPLTVEVPPGARLLPGATQVRLQGSFQESEIALGPTGADDPVGAVTIRPGATVAQQFRLEDRTEVNAVDLLLAPLGPRARLQIDVRSDLGGNPGQESLLPAPVEFEVNRRQDGGPSWKTVALPSPIQLDSEQGGAKTSHWMVVQSLQGEADWPTRQAQTDTSDLRKSRNAEHSWHSVEVAGSDHPLEALFRLRRRPSLPQVPLELVIGTGQEAQRVSLERFQPQGGIDFTVDLPELADAYNRFLDQKRPATCPSGEHLLNGNFDDWAVLGDALQEPIRVPLETVSDGSRVDTTPTALALSPNGNWAYIASFAASTAFLHWIDLADNAVVLSKDLALSKITSLAVSPDGSRIYAAADTQLVAIDAATGEAVASDLPIGDTANHLAASRTRLLAAGRFPQMGGFASLDPTAVERGAILPAGEAPHVILGDSKPSALALSSDGQRLLVAVQSEGESTLQLVDADSGQPFADPIGVDTPIRSIALTPDGRSAWVALDGQKSLSVIDLESGSVTRTVSLEHPATAIAISSDGRRIFVASEAPGQEAFLTLIDPSCDRAEDAIELGMSAQHIAVTPQADRIVVTDPIANAVCIAASGIRQPADWTITSGQAAMASLLGDPGRGVKLGSISEAEEACTATALSQVVPVAPSCPFDFSFDGIAFNVSDVVAEVHWIGADCGLIRTDRIPFEVSKPPVIAAAERLASASKVAAVPLPHCRRLTSPSEAVLAEVRFLIPPGGQADIGRASLEATANAVENTDFCVGEGNRPSGWTLQPAAAAGFSVLPGQAGAELDNSGSEPVELHQTIPVTSGQEFLLQARVRVLGEPPTSAPRLELVWLDAAGQPLGTPGEQLTLGTDFAGAARRGRPPQGAASADLSLVVPPRSRVAVEQVSLTFQETTPVPLTFIAHSPGELTVSQPVVAFETIAAPPPAPPESGLCMPTPPHLEPGEPCQECFCSCCQAQVKAHGAQPGLTQSGRPAQVATCPKCRGPVVTVGGVPGPAETMPLRPLPPPSLRRPSFTISRSIALPESGDLPPLTDIIGIAEARAGLLADAGIETVAQLAAASPARVADALRGFTAESFIRKARLLLSKHRRSSA